MGDLSSRRGRPQGMEPRGSLQVIRAEVPMSEMLTYDADLTSMTGGRGSYHMEMSHYDEVPGHLQEKIVAAAKAERGRGRKRSLGSARTGRAKMERSPREARDPCWRRLPARGVLARPGGAEGRRPAQEVKQAGTGCPPKRTKFVTPVYPPEAQAQGLRGIVILELVIDTQGKVAAVDVVRSVPPFDEAAFAAAAQWEYEVTKGGRRPVPVRLTVPITFALQVPGDHARAGHPRAAPGRRPRLPPPERSRARPPSRPT